MRGYFNRQLPLMALLRLVVLCQRTLYDEHQRNTLSWPNKLGTVKMAKREGGVESREYQIESRCIERADLTTDPILHDQIFKR